MSKYCIALLVCMRFANAEIVDRVSLVVDGHSIKHSDIIKEIRLTKLLNREPPAFDLSEQKKAVGSQGIGDDLNRGSHGGIIGEQLIKPDADDQRGFRTNGNKSIPLERISGLKNDPR